MGRKPCCDKEGVNRGTWSMIEDQILTNFIRVHGEGKWRNVPKRAGLNRCGKSCRLRWLNYLRPDIKRGNFSEDEEDLIIRLHNLLGNRWSLIAGRLPGRTDNEIKNFWNTNLGKRVHQNNYPIAMRKTPTTLPSPHHHQHTKFTCPADHTSQPNPVIRAKPVRCTKKIIFPKPHAAELETQNDATASACNTAGDPRNNDRVSSFGFLEDFDVDRLMLIPGETQVVPEANVNDYEEVNGFENCDGDDDDEANVTDHQNDWTVEKFFESADHDAKDVDFSSLNLLSDSFMLDFDPSYV